MNKKPKIIDGLVVRQEDDEAFLFNPETGVVKTLNATALFIWELCDGMHTQEEIVKELFEHFEGVSHEKAAADLDNFLSDALRLGFLEKGEDQ